MKRFALQTVKFLPYPDRLSSEAHLWAQQRAETSTMEDIQCVQINPSAAPTCTSIPTLISTHSLTSSYASTRTYFSSFLLRPPPPPTRPPLHSCCGSSKPDKVVQPPHLSYPLLSPSTARVLPGAAEEANFPFRADLFHFFSLLIVKSISFSLDSLVLESKTYWFL